MWFFLRRGVGVEEGEDELHDARRMRDLLVARGWRLGDRLHYLEDPDGDHDEVSWGRRIRESWHALGQIAGAVAPVRRTRG